MTATARALPHSADLRTSQLHVTVRQHSARAARAASTTTLRFRTAALALRAGAVTSAVAGLGVVVTLFQSGITGVPLAAGTLFVVVGTLVTVLVATSVADLLNHAARSAGAHRASGPMSLSRVP